MRKFEKPEHESDEADDYTTTFYCAEKSTGSAEQS